MESSQKKRKLSIKNEYDSENVDDPSEVEKSDSESEGGTSNPEDSPARKRIKLSPGSENDNGGGECECESESGSERPDGDTQHQDGPPLKKIRLTHRDSNETNQKFGLSDSTGSEKEEQSEFSYENINANFFAEELTSDDEILTFQCPEKFDVTTMLNITIDLGKVTKMKDQVNKYVCQTVENSKKEKLNCVVPSKKHGAVFLKLPVVGHILLRQVLKMPKKNVSSFVDTDAENLQLPISNQMKRHPLLGTKWNDHLSKVKKEMRRHKKLFRRLLKNEKSMEKAEKEKKEMKKKMKDELSLLKKLINDGDSS